MELFELPVSLQIDATVSATYDAWIDQKIAEQWLCDRMDGQWTPGKKVAWCFGDVHQELRVVEVVPDRLLKFRWNAAGNRPETEVTIKFEECSRGTALKLIERAWPLSIENVHFALDAACGWENLFCRLKAWLESKVKLR